MVHMLGGNLLLAGIVIKLSQGQTVIESLTGQADAAYWLILAGVAVNAAIPPFNAWIADAYPESTMGGTVYMGSFTTKVGVFCLIKLFAGTELLLYFGVFMGSMGSLHGPHRKRFQTAVCLSHNKSGGIHDSLSGHRRRKSA